MLFLLVNTKQQAVGQKNPNSSYNFKQAFDLLF